jgi:hypothetical protein
MLLGGSALRERREVDRGPVREEGVSENAIGFGQFVGGPSAGPQFQAVLTSGGDGFRFDKSEVHVKKCGGGTMLATFAFDVCHDVYRAAREVIDSRVPTLNPESSGKYEWRPDRMPRLAEFVCDFARAGERALGENGGRKGSEGSEGSEGSKGSKGRGGYEGIATLAGGEVSANDLSATSSSSFTSSTSCLALRARPSHLSLRANPSPAAGGFRASRMAMFRVYFLGGAEYEAARRHLGISEFTWADWADEIRRLVGRELTRAGVFPPSKYFREVSAKAS